MLKKSQILLGFTVKNSVVLTVKAMCGDFIEDSLVVINMPSTLQNNG